MKPMMYRLNRNYLYPRKYEPRSYFVLLSINTYVDTAPICMHPRHKFVFGTDITYKPLSLGQLTYETPVVTLKQRYL